MIDPSEFISGLSSRGVTLFTGVPDSLLSAFISTLDAQVPPDRHLVAANEGNAVGVAIGHHLSSGNFALVYMQNSGLGNAHNPLISLASPEVYGIPMVIVVGWRGEPGLPDEPQHIPQGLATTDHLSSLGIPWIVVRPGSKVSEILAWVEEKLAEATRPIALLVGAGSFGGATLETDSEISKDGMLREDALRTLLPLFGESLVISTTGKTSRELYELRRSEQIRGFDFLTIGGMGHASSIALGAAIGDPNLNIVCLDGDGALIMHMGALPVIGANAPSNFIHVVLNNQVHESVGGQPTAAKVVSLEALSRAVGYVAYEFASTSSGVEQSWKRLQKVLGPRMMEIRIRPGSRQGLGRPDMSPAALKDSLMSALGKSR